ANVENRARVLADALERDEAVDLAQRQRQRRVEQVRERPAQQLVIVRRGICGVLGGVRHDLQHQPQTYPIGGSGSSRLGATCYEVRHVTEPHYESVRSAAAAEVGAAIAMAAGGAAAFALVEYPLTLWMYAGEIG